VRPDCFVWVALADPSDDEIDVMAEEFGLHPLAVEDARKGHQRPKIEEYGNSLFVVARRGARPTRPARRWPPARSAPVGPNYVLSVRHRTQ
jgi:magnesium transporter